MAPATFVEHQERIAFAAGRRGVRWVRMHGPTLDLAPWRDLPPLPPEVGEGLRIAAGIPLHGRDADEGHLLSELDLDDHASSTKGCYVGQEIVARIHTYGHANRRLCVVRIGGEGVVAAGAQVADGDGEPVGRVTSAARFPGAPYTLALCVLPRGLWEPGTPLFLAEPARRPVEVVPAADGPARP
jgi:folate-binding protein YgfZ